MNNIFVVYKMLIEPSILAMLGGTLVTSSLLTYSSSNIDKNHDYDKDAEKLSIVGTVVGFGGLLLTIFALLYTKMYPTSHQFLIGVFAFLWLILVSLLFISYFSYDYLDKGYHLPSGEKYTLNKTERDLLFIAFCITLVSVTVGLCYVFTHGIESEFFDDITGGVFDIKERFSNVFSRINNKKNNISEDIELQNFLIDLKVD
jgi:hypothetical protein